MIKSAIDITPDITPEVRQFIQKTNQSAANYRLIKIKTQDGYVQAGNFLQEIKGRLNKLEEIRKSLTKPLDETKRRIMDLFRAPEEALKGAEQSIKVAIGDYRSEQERIRQEQERIAQSEAKKREDAERKKLEEKASKAEAKGNDDKAEELRQQASAVSVPTPVIQKSIPKVDGLKFRTVWKARILDFSQLPVDQLYITDKQKEAHQSHFNKLAASTSGSLKFSGVEFYSEEEAASASK